MWTKAVDVIKVGCKLWTCSPVSLCADCGGICCQFVCGLWQLNNVFIEGVSFGPVHLSVFARAMAAFAVSLCVDYGNVGFTLSAL